MKLFDRRAYVQLATFLLLCLGGWGLFCGCKSNARKENASATVPVPAASGQEAAPITTDQATLTNPELPIELIPIDSFFNCFQMRYKPRHCEVAADFTKSVDPKLRHFQRVAVILSNGQQAEIHLQDFGAFAIWKNAAGNLEMLTTMVTNIGVLMHLHTLGPDLKTLGTFEVARRTYIMGEESVKKGTFQAGEGDNYVYTVVTRRKNTLIDSLNGLVVVAQTGNYRVLDEVR